MRIERAVDRRPSAQTKRSPSVVRTVAELDRHPIWPVVEADHLLAKVIVIAPEGSQQGSIDGAPPTEPVMIGIGAEHSSFPIQVGPKGELETDPIVLSSPFCEVALGDGEDDDAGTTVLEGGLASLEHSTSQPRSRSNTAAVSPPIEPPATRTRGQPMATPAQPSSSTVTKRSGLSPTFSRSWMSAVSGVCSRYLVSPTR